MNRELFITRLAFINNDEINKINKNSSIAYLKIYNKTCIYKQ